MTEQQSEHVRLAMAATEAYIRDHKKIKVPEDTSEELRTKQAGVFVCIKIAGELRGCIGTIEPCCNSLAEEIINNAISACSKDPRFALVSPQELPHLQYSVDVLTEPEPIDTLDQLDPKRYGVIVTSGYKKGLLLPDLEGVDTVEYQVSIAMQKAGIGRGEAVRLQRFEVLRYH